MEASDLFWFMGVVAAYLVECAEAGIEMADRLAVGAVLDDLCRLASVPSPLVIELAVGNVRLLPSPGGVPKRYPNNQTEWRSPTAVRPEGGGGDETSIPVLPSQWKGT